MCLRSVSKFEILDIASAICDVPLMVFGVVAIAEAGTIGLKWSAIGGETFFCFWFFGVEHFGTLQ